MLTFWQNRRMMQTLRSEQDGAETREGVTVFAFEMTNPRANHATPFKRRLTTNLSCPRGKKTCQIVCNYPFNKWTMSLHKETIVNASNCRVENTKHGIPTDREREKRVPIVYLKCQKKKIIRNIFEMLAKCIRVVESNKPKQKKAHLWVVRQQTRKNWCQDSGCWIVIPVALIRDRHNCSDIAVCASANKLC